MHDKYRKKSGETAFAAVLVALSAVLLWKAAGISGFTALSSPGAFPMAVTAVMLGSSLLILLRTARASGGHPDGAPRRIMPPVVLAVTGLIALYAVLLVPLGFLPTSFLFLAVAILLLRGGGAMFALGISLAALIGVYIVFRLVFTVLMPPGIVPEAEILAWLRTLLSGAGR